MTNAGLPIVAPQASSSMSTTGRGQLPSVSLRNSSGDSSSNSIRRPKTRYLGQALTAWVEQTAADGRFGKVPVPFTTDSISGWIRIKGLQLERTPYSVRIDRSRHLLTVMKLGKAIMRVPAATGAPASPTPIGRFFVTDRVPIPSGGAFGTYAFGLSRLQPHLPVGWSGGDQIAIHGTDDPRSIGTSSTAGCLHVGRSALARLVPLLLPGTPVIIRP